VKWDGTRAETGFRLSAKRTSPFKSAGRLVQSTTGSRGVHIRGSNAGYIIFRGSVKSTGYPLLSSVSPSLPLPCVTVCHHISTGLYFITCFKSNLVYIWHSGDPSYLGVLQLLGLMARFLPTPVNSCCLHCQREFAWLQASSAVWIRYSLFRVVSYRYFGTTYRFHLQGIW